MIPRTCGACFRRQNTRQLGGPRGGMGLTFTGTETSISSLDRRLLRCDSEFAFEPLSPPYLRELARHAWCKLEDGATTDWEKSIATTWRYAHLAVHRKRPAVDLVVPPWQEQVHKRPINGHLEFSNRKVPLFKLFVQMRASSSIG